MSDENGYRNLSRRQLLKGGAAVAGALGLSHAGRWFGEARAQTVGEKAAVLLVFLRGGYNALFSSADSFASNSTFGASSSNIKSLGNSLFVDNATFGTLPVSALSKMATIGVAHGISSHTTAQMADWTLNGQRSYALMLAAAMGGTAPIRAAVLGTNMPPGSGLPAESGVSLQSITDMKSTINALGGGTVDPATPDRAIEAKGIVAAQKMSAAAVAMNPVSLKTLDEGYATAIDVLTKPVPLFDFAAMAAAYGISVTSTGVSGFTAQMLAAELMITAGANVAIAVNSGWDSHGDTSGSSVRNKMTGTILPGLKTFLGRMMADPTRNVVTVIFGDFARSLPGSDHAKLVAATVIGKYVKVGTTGRVIAPPSGSLSLPSGTGNTQQFWSYIAAAAKVASNPFGPNPHPLVV